MDSPGSPLVISLRAAVAAAPTDLVLRLHLAEMLLQEGLNSEALAEADRVLQVEAANAKAFEIARRARLASTSAPFSSSDQDLTERAQETSSHKDQKPTDQKPAPEEQSPNLQIDWAALEEELGHLVPPLYIGETSRPTDYFSVEKIGLRLADVGGMQDVKERLEAAFLAPARNPALRQIFGKSLRGGLLLYGPPGCGKTYLAKALAGELGGRFVSVHLHEILDMFVGRSERNLHEVFEVARRNSPCVIFFDEIDAIGQNRSNMRSAARSVVNQLLTELDEVAGQSQGIFVLAATNMPWDVDPALRRPGRLDRTVLVLPPDERARHDIFRSHLRGRPIANIDLGQLAKATEGFSGADIAHACETAVDRALLESAQLGEPRLIEMSDLLLAVEEIQTSSRPWFDMARNVALFANDDGHYDDLLRYLKKRRLL